MNLDQNRCVNCNEILHGKYCSNCGQKKIENEDKRLVHFVNDVISSLFFADGKIFKTFKVILTKPGELSQLKYRDHLY